MNKVFLKKDQVNLINGGYLSDTKGNPVFNLDFYNAQKHAEYVVTFAEMAKDKDFNSKEAYSLNKFVEEVKQVLTSKGINYLKVPKKVTGKLTKQLADEALTFMNSLEEASKVEKINKFLQQFNILKEFEEFGLFFEQDIVKLNKIYTIKEIIQSVEKVIDLL